MTGVNCMHYNGSTQHIGLEPMSTQIDRVISQMRNLIVSGELRPGERIVELQFTDRLKVSRTPLRLALAELEREGILERLPARGFRVRGFSVDDILDAIEVRGALEATAVRLAVEKHWSPDLVATLERIVDDGRALVQRAGIDPDGQIDAHAWAEVNARFHAAIVEGAANRALASAVEKNNTTPFVSPGSVILPPTRTAVELELVARAQEDHEDICTAIVKRESTRAVALIQEHTYRSSQNKRRLISRMQQARSEQESTVVFPPILTSLSM